MEVQNVDSRLTLYSIWRLDCHKRVEQWKLFSAFCRVAGKKIYKQKYGQINSQTLSQTLLSCTKPKYLPRKRDIGCHTSRNFLYTKKVIRTNKIERILQIYAILYFIGSISSYCKGFLNNWVFSSHPPPLWGAPPRYRGPEEPLVRSTHFLM